LKRILPLLLVLAVVTAGCGRFGSNKTTATTLLGEGEGVGAGLTTPTTRTPPVTTAPGKTTATVAACPHKDPTSEIEYGGRLRLTLTLSTLCPAHADDIGFTLKLTNISSSPIHYDKNQAQFFSLLAYPSGSGRIRWEDTNCQPPARDRNAPAATLNAGESTTITSLYPAAKSVADREKCRRLQAGDYDANALFLVCDDAAYTDGYCDISKDTQYKAQPVRITVTS
jgi:hypothetical protein